MGYERLGKVARDGGVPNSFLVIVALGAARDRDHRLDRRLSSTRFCPTMPRIRY